MGDELRYATASELRGWYASGSLSPVEYTTATLHLLEREQPVLHAFLTVTAESALTQARDAERLIRSRGEQAWDGRALLGVPVSVKDLTPVAGVRTTRGSLRQADWVPDRDAPAVARLRAAGAVLIGKTATSEYGWSAGTVNRLAPPVANPWNPARSAGGSSGGAAAATAAGIGVGALGTDGAGSIRVPAAFCGVVGFKPSFGRVPYVPVSPEGLSHLGPLARDVATAELITEVIAGPHPGDPLSLGWRAAPPGPAASARIGWLRWPGPVTETESVARAAAAALGNVTELEVPFPDPYPDLVTILAAFEAFGQHPDDDPLSDPERLRIVAHGRTLSATDLARALAGRMRLAQRVSELMERFDVLATPTVTVEPFDVNAWRPDAAGAALDWLAWCRTVYPFNLTGQPAISVPAGFTAAGLPAGLQLAGRPGQDALVLAVARRFELTRPWRSAYARKDGRPAANRDPAANQQPAAHRNGRPGYARENEEHA